MPESPKRRLFLDGRKYRSYTRCCGIKVIRLLRVVHGVQPRRNAPVQELSFDGRHLLHHIRLTSALRAQDLPQPRQRPRQRCDRPKPQHEREPHHPFGRYSRMMQLEW